MEDFFAIIFIIGMTLGFIFGFFWIMQKFFGASFHHPFHHQQAQYNKYQQEDELRRIANSDPHIYHKAVANCRKKLFKPTPPNILDEVYKLQMKK